MTAAAKVIAAARGMVQAGLTTGTVGNVSARLERRRMLITPTRRYAEDLTDADLVEAAIDADHAQMRASREWRLHAAIYRARPDIAAIVHTHSPWATLRSFDPEPIVVATEERTYLDLRNIRVVSPTPAGTRAVADLAVDALGNERAVLLGRHGVIGTGADPRDALAVCAAVEHQALIDHIRRVGDHMTQVGHAVPTNEDLKPASRCGWPRRWSGP